MDKVFDKDAERFDADVITENDSSKAHKACIDCGSYVSDDDKVLCYSCDI